MQRIAFDRSVSDGFRTAKVESIVSTLQGRRLFVGTADGFLTLYECRQDHSVAGKSYSCYVLESIRKQSKDKKAANALQNVETWRVILGIIDGMIYAYDSQFYQQMATIPDSKGCHVYAVNELAKMIVVANKKKLSQYTWQEPGFQLKKEFNLTDTPKNIHFVSGSVIVAYKKYYECLDVNSGGVSRIIDVDKEHKMVIGEIPHSAFRSDCILLSLGLQGILLNTECVLSGASFTFGSQNEERIEWTAPPTSIHILNPFLLTLLSDSSVEIHEMATLTSIQKLQISSPSPHALSLAICTDDSRSNSSSSIFQNHAYLCNGEQLSVLRMIPLSNQVEVLLANSLYEEAINLCTGCKHKDMLAGIDLVRLFESSANTLLSKGDFEKAVQRFILAKSDFVLVAKNFPDLIPLPLHLSFGITQVRKWSGAVLNRAASAVVQLCEFHKQKLSKRADLSEKSKESGIIGPNIVKTAPKQLSGAQDDDDDDDDDYIADPDEQIRRSQLCDTMHLFALMHCNPIRRAAVVDLLSSPNRCQIESCSVLLASHGNAYTEPLLWLYRSQGQHGRVLQALSEDKCVAVGAWTKDQFYNWTADYLRWLWYHDDDASLPRQALVALRTVLEYDAEMGLSVLVCRPTNKSSFGGKGVTISEVLNYLRSTSPKINYSRASTSYGHGASTATIKLREGNSIWQTEKGVAAIIASTPLVNGHALAVAFLECLVSSGEAPPNMHDEFAQLLVEGLPFDNEISVDHSKNDIELKTDDSEIVQLYKVYRRKLQSFLGNSQEYHPSKVLKFLPRQYLHENALVLSKLGRHREVIKIYLQQLRSLELGESYCETMFYQVNSTTLTKPRESKINNNTNTLSSAGEIYLILFQVILGEEDDEDLNEVDREDRFRNVVKLAEKYFDRFETNAFLELLPRKTATIALLLRYFQLVLEFQQTKKRNLQIAHQLLRIREVHLRTQGIEIEKIMESSSGSMSAAPSMKNLNFHR